MEGIGSTCALLQVQIPLIQDNFMGRYKGWFLLTSIALLSAGAIIYFFIPNVEGGIFSHEMRILKNGQQMIDEGRQTFRFDTFGDEAFWGDTLKLHQAIAGAANGGVGPGVSPATALAVGLKVDVDALPPALVEQLEQGQVNLNDSPTTLAHLK